MEQKVDQRNFSVSDHPDLLDGDYDRLDCGCFVERGGAKYQECRAQAWCSSRSETLIKRVTDLEEGIRSAIGRLERLADLGEGFPGLLDELQNLLRKN